MVDNLVRHARARRVTYSVMSAAASFCLVIPMTHASAQRVAALASDATVDAKQRVTVNFDNTSLRVVVNAIAHAAGLNPSYEVSLIPPRIHVTIHATNMLVGDAFAYVLRGTGLGARIQATGNVVIFADQAAAALAGGVAGMVTDAKTKKGVANAVLTVDRNTAGVRTDTRGTFRIAGLASGTHLLAIRAIGYARVTRSVTVIDDTIATLDVALDAVTNVLDQVVVTATGEQRYRELGHVVAKLNADSLVKNAPITSVAELLTARVPGLEVVTQNGGMAGGEVALRLRGQTTNYLDPQPIVIVDGVRYKNTNAIVSPATGGTVVGEDQRPFGVEQRSPLNDLNVNDIETVEVVKGPSASTLYGPDAANGVIVITTKRAKAGKTEWHVYVHPRLNDISGGGTGSVPQRGWWAWGHDPNTGAPVSYSCVLAYVAYGICAQDSITRAPTAVAIPQLNAIQQNRPQWQYGADVGGGTDALRYFLSAGYDSQTGSLRLPDAVAQVIKQQFGVATLSNALRNPNSQQSLNLHSNLTATPSSKTTVTLATTYAQATQRSLSTTAYVNTAVTGAVQPGCSQTNPSNLCLTPDHYNPTPFLQTSQENVSRFTGSANGVLQATSWLTANATLGLDLDGSIDRGIRPPGSSYSGDGGEANDFRRNNVGRTGTLGATATAHPGRFSFRSSIGTQYTYSHQDGINTNGQNLAPGSTSISTATYVNAQQIWSETVTLGTYGEEVVGLNDRLFVTGALRLDGSTSFGDAYRARPYPKVGVSWIASDEPFLSHVPGLSELRFRYSFGAASRYPTSAMKLGSIYSYQTVIENQNQNLYARGALGNPLLRPERTREAEYGMDATLFSGAVTAGLTWYNRRTTDQLNGYANPRGLPSQWLNIGDVSAHGFEATADARLFDTRSVRATLQFSYSYHTDKLLSLGAAPNAGGCSGCYAVGYPLSSAFTRPIIGVADTVGGGPDGIIIDSREIVRDSVIRFMGVMFPPTTIGLTPALTLLEGRVRLSTSFDRQTGFVIEDNPSQASSIALAAVQPGSSLMQQAQLMGGVPYERGDFTRWREFTVSADLPSRLVRSLLLKRGTVNFQVRNLALWTRYGGSDPESQPGSGVAGGVFAGPVPTGIPLARAWTISFDVTP